MAISMLKIRRPLGRLIFNMGIAIPGKTVFLIETAPWWLLETKPFFRVHCQIKDQKIADCNNYTFEHSKQIWTDH